MTAYAKFLLTKGEDLTIWVSRAIIYGDTMARYYESVWARQLSERG